MNEKILCVDDDPNVLSAYKRTLRKNFEIYTAESGEEALSLIKSEGEFAVIVSDMRMPVMDGVQFLSIVRNITPNSVRMMLTGNADQQTAVDAVNEGNIFRFLTKPCVPAALAQALDAGLAQYRLITAEQELLEETLNNSLQVMVEILSLANPTAFKRSKRVKRLARNIAESLNLKKPWEVEIASMLSQIGCITVPEETLQKISKCQPLEEKELDLYHHHPQVGHDLIARIPRMERIAQIIANQNRRLNDDVETRFCIDDVDETTMGARILKVVLDFDKLLDMGNLPHKAYKELATRTGWYDPNVMNSLKVFLDASVEEFISVELSVHTLKLGMLLDENIYSSRNVLLLSEGQEITLPIILRLIKFAEAEMISENIRVSVPKSKFQSEDVKDEENFAAFPSKNAPENQLSL